MSSELLQVRGTFTYPTRSALTAALGAAVEQLDDDDDVEHLLRDAWVRGFAARGTTLELRITATGAAQHRFALAALADVLGASAESGVMVTRRGAAELDCHVCGEDAPAFVMSTASSPSG